MSLRGLDEFITGNYGEDYWGDQEDDPDAFVCYQCRSSAHSWCKGDQCSCPYRYGKTAVEHGPYRGPVKLVRDSPSGGTSSLDVKPTSNVHSLGSRNKPTAGFAKQQPVGEVIPETRQIRTQPEAGEAVTLPRRGNNNSAPDNQTIKRTYKW